MSFQFSFMSIQMKNVAVVKNSVLRDQVLKENINIRDGFFLRALFVFKKYTFDKICI